MANRKKLLDDNGQPYCQCCGYSHKESDSLVVCLKCYRLFERYVRVDKLRKAAIVLKALAMQEGVTLDELTAENTTLDEGGKLRITPITGIGCQNVGMDEKGKIVKLPPL